MRLLEDDELAQKIIANGHEAAAKFSWTKVRTEWLAVYENLHESRKLKKSKVVDKR